MFRFNVASFFLSMRVNFCSQQHHYLPYWHQQWQILRVCVIAAITVPWGFLTMFHWNILCAPPGSFTITYFELVLSWNILLVESSICFVLSLFRSFSNDLLKKHEVPFLRDFEWSSIHLHLLEFYCNPSWTCIVSEISCWLSYPCVLFWIYFEVSSMSRWRTLKWVVLAFDSLLDVLCMHHATWYCTGSWIMGLIC